MTDPILVALALAPCVALLVLYARQVRTAPEPWPRVAACVAGGVAAFGVVVAFSIARRSLLPPLPGPLESLLVVGPVEETAKLAAVLVAAGAASRWERVTSGIMFAVAVAVGFAAIENVVYVQKYGAGTAVLRALTAVPGHALHSAIVGVALGTVHRQGPRRARRGVVLGLLIASAAHGAYDALLAIGGPVSVGAVGVLAAEVWIVRRLFRRARSEDTTELVDALARVGLLEDAPAGVLRDLARKSVRMSVRAGEPLAHTGGPGDAMFLILRGRVSVLKQGEEVAQLGPGDVVGETALIAGRRRNADIVAIAPGMVLRVDWTAMLKSVAATPEMAARLLATARARTVKTALPSTGDFRALALDEAALQLGVDDRIPRLLSRIPLFSEIARDRLVELAGATMILRRGPAFTLVRQGGAPIGLAVLFDGEVDVLRDGRLVATLVRGDYFGESGLLTGWPAMATVRTRRPVEVGLLRWQDLAEHVGAHPEIGRRLLAELGRRAGELHVDGDPTRPGALRRAAEGLVRRLGLGTPPPRTPKARALAQVCPDLLAFPAGAAEALADLVTPGPPGDSVVHLGTDGILRDPAGLLGLPQHVTRQGLAPVRVGGAPLEVPEQAALTEAPDGWRLDDARLESALAKSPDLLRWLARRTVAPKH